MSEGKRFRDAINGFNKSDVNLYIEKMLKEFDNKLRQKDEEISYLKSQNRELKARYDDINSKAQEIDSMKAKVADILMKAQEKADIMFQEAKLQAFEEKKKIEKMVEQEKEKLVDIRTELKYLKEEVVSTLKKYEGQLTDILDDEAG